VIDDGTVSRWETRRSAGRRRTPSLRWFRQNARGWTVADRGRLGRDRGGRAAGADLAKLLRAVAKAEIDRLKYFRVTGGTIAGVPVDISRTGYTGDLGYEIWMPARARSTCGTR
jgi:aminomethyltransferase